jgi:hypothetical protein
MVEACNYYGNRTSASVRAWFEHKSINPQNHGEILYNMSQYPILAKRFCLESNYNNSFIRLKDARKYANITNKNSLLIKFTELNTFGVYEPEELNTFINNMLKFVYENNLNVGMFSDVTYVDLKCNLTQFLFDDQGQKLIFKYKDKNTIDKLSNYIKNTVGYDISIMEVNNKYEVTVQNLNENKLESDKLYKRIEKGVDENISNNMREIKNMVRVPDCKNVGLITVDSKTKFLTTEDIIKLSGVHSITINNINAPITGNNNNININTIPINQRWKANTLAWIRSNPPHHMEKTTVYHKRYSDANTNPCADSEFGKIIKNEPYRTKKTNTGRYWISK